MPTTVGVLVAAIVSGVVVAALASVDVAVESEAVVATSCVDVADVEGVDVLASVSGVVVSSLVVMLGGVLVATVDDASLSGTSVEMVEDAESVLVASALVVDASPL